MNKLAAIAFLTLITLLASCEKRKIYKEYQQLNGTWYFQAANGEAAADTLLQYLYFDTRDMKKKHLKDENHHYSAGINHQAKGGLQISFRVHNSTDDSLTVLRVRDIGKLMRNGGNGLSPYIPSKEEKYLDSLLVGTWKYTIEGSMLTWQNKKKAELVFSKGGL